VLSCYGAEGAAGKRIFPKGSEYFRALDLTPLDKVRVVILGQDPYHGRGAGAWAQLSRCNVRGAAAAEPREHLQGAEKLILASIPPRHGNLTHWAEQGVLLLNSVLTVELGQAASHQGKRLGKVHRCGDRAGGAAGAADRVHPLGCLCAEEGGVRERYKPGRAAPRVIKSAHPSPLSAHNGFLGSRPFSRANAFLEADGEAPIDWKLPD
jgi:uracil-DNA glycosylase